MLCRVKESDSNTAQAVRGEKRHISVEVKDRAQHITSEDTSTWNVGGILWDIFPDES